MNTNFLQASWQTRQPINFTRLEPNNKTHAVEEGLQARVKDPLWLLGRQWQVGEFKADNGGQLVRTELDISYRSLNSIEWKTEKNHSNVTEQFDIKIPLEMKVEEELSASDNFQAKGWDSQRLEYNFCIKNNNTKLIAEEYDGNDLDWFNFDLIEIGQIDDIKDAIAVKPSPVSFNGMPLARWWSIEDNLINLGKINRPYLNFLTMMLLEFSLIYSNDWFVIPLEHEVGNIRYIDKCRVIDSFGIISEVSPVIDKTPDKQGWEVFTLSSKLSSEYSDGRIFYLPNNLYHALESEDIEKVSFFRDEMANLVWAIEQRYQEGKIVINRNDEEEQIPELPKPSLYWDTQNQTLIESFLIEGEGEPGNRFIGPIVLYNPMTKLPNHWIPYIPRQLNTDGQFILKRARTLKDLSNGFQYKGIFLRESKYLFEEEVLRTGIVLSRLFQLARDCDGKRYFWLSRKKKIDELRKSSGLQFDSLIEK